MASQSRHYGKAKLRWQPNKEGGYSGVVISDGKSSDTFHDMDENRLLVRLQNEAGKLEPGYVGIEGAISRFLEFMPGGLRGDRSVHEEQSYKRNACRVLNEVLPLEEALEADQSAAEAVRRAKVWLNILSPFETMHLKQVLENPEGPAFLRGAARFSSGQYAAGAQQMESALRRYGRQSWPKATYLGYLWNPSINMFCKPEVTKDFASRIGHDFQYVYDPAINERVYLALMDLAKQTLDATRHLGAEDYIDVQSFIYVVGGYREQDRPL